jgi:hypothetical protein
MELGEYRESADIDFLCASRDGYRALRESVGESSLGRMASGSGPVLAREVRADQYGVRTWIVAGDLRLKFEVIREARIELAGTRIASLPVPCLDRMHAFAEKLLANADRGTDASTLSRDAVDLAFMVEGWGDGEARRGALLARAAYGEEVSRKLAFVVDKLRNDRRYRKSCVEGLAIEESRTLGRGLERLARGIDPA